MEQIKRFLVLFLFTILPFELYAQFAPMHTGFYSYREGTSYYKFRSPNRIEFGKRPIFYGEKEEIYKTGTYSIDDSNEVPFINIHWNDNTSERYLILLGDVFMCLYNNNSEPILYHHFRKNFGEYEDFSEWSFSGIVQMANITASSSLIEGNIDYSPSIERLGLKINSSWAVRGGVNQSLFIKRPSLSAELYISIGYVHLSQINLYRENARPKKIRISQINNESNFMEFELIDTPNFQRFDIDGLGYEIKIEIKEIYLGTKYNDTCINSIMTRYYGN
jgi:hypothetical protein